MEDFQEDRRELPKKMRKKLESMLEAKGDGAITALFAYYASQ
jgi:sulfide dehydrogenase cytochrome subunit